MEEKNMKCGSCGKSLSNEVGGVLFKCPSCDKSDVVRCYNCRQNAATYECGGCGFKGPNW